MASKKTTNPVNNEETSKKRTRKTANKELGKNAETALNQAEEVFNGKGTEEESATSTAPQKVPVITINGTPIPMNAMGLHALATTFYLNAIGCNTDEEAEAASNAHFDDPDPNDSDTRGKHRQEGPTLFSLNVSKGQFQSRPKTHLGSFEFEIFINFPALIRV